MKIIFIGGNEPYLVDQYIREIKAKIDLPEFNFLERDCLDAVAMDYLVSVPIMATQRVLIVRVEELCDIAGETFDAITRLKTEAVFVVCFKKYDARKSFYRNLDKKHIRLFEKEKQRSILPAFVQDYIARQNAKISDSALSELLRLENYVANDAVNMYTIRNDLDSLIALSKNISVEDVRSVVSDHDVENVFILAKLLKARDISGLMKQADLLQGQEIGALSALLREYRISYKAKFFPLKEIGAYNNLFGNLNHSELSRNISFLTKMLDSIKQGKVPRSVALKESFLQLL